MRKSNRCSVAIAVVFSVIGIVSCRRQHTKSRPDSMPWFPVQFITPTDQSAFLLSHDRDLNTNTRQENTTKGLHTQQAVGVLGRHQTTLQAIYGPFIVAENIMPPINATIYNELNRFTVKTELLTPVLPAHDPTVRVLFRWEKEIDLGNGAAGETTGQEPLPCAKLVLINDGKELSTACRIQGGVLACVAKLPIPPSWWSKMCESDLIRAYYSVFEVAENAPCLPDSHNAIPPRDGEPEDPVAYPQYHIDDIRMAPYNDGAFSVNREDHYVWLHTPTAELGSNTKFQAPVSILSNFTAAGCVIRAKARQGLQVVAVHTVDTEQWSISSRVNPKGSLAMVTVLRREGAIASYDGSDSETGALDNGTSPRSGTPIAFTVEFEVLNGTDGSRPINWRIDYEEEMHTIQLRTNVEVRPHSTQAIVAFVKEGNLVNTAVLNGIRVNKPMTVLAASYAGQVVDVSGQASCRSDDTNIIQVDKHCRRVYVDGTEKSGSLSVLVQSTYEGRTTDLMLSVWMPEFPLEVVLGDDKLSMIKGWKIPAYETISHRMTRGAELLDLNEKETKHGGKGKCRLRFQQSSVEVYTRYYAPHANTVPGQTGRKVYLFGGDIKNHITDLVIDQLAVEDTSVANVHDGHVYGENAGVTIVKVEAPYSRENLGQASVTVATDKVTVEGLHVSMVTGMTMKLHQSRSGMVGIMVAKVKGRDQIFAQNQEVILDGLLTFSDGASTNLQDVRQQDFTSVMTSLNPEILSESPLTTSHLPSLVVFGEGVTNVMLEVKIPETCQKWKNNNVVSFDVLNVNISFSGGSHVSSETKENGRASLTQELGHIDYGVSMPDYNPNDLDQKEGRGGGKGRNGKKDKHVISSIPIDIDISDLYPRYKNTDDAQYDDLYPHRNADGEGGGDHVEYEDNQLDFNFFNKDKDELTPLEIGMYVLLAVFCVAIFAFMINCVLFMARYRKSKRVPSVGASTYPQNWVLFGLDDRVPAPLATAEEMLPLQDRCSEYPGHCGTGAVEECVCTESEVSIERHSNQEDCGIHDTCEQGSHGTLHCGGRGGDTRDYGKETCDCCNGVCECEMDTAMHDRESVDREGEEEEEDRGSVSICSSESRENMEAAMNNHTAPSAVAGNCNTELDSVVTHVDPLGSSSEDYVTENDANAAVVPSVAIAPEETSTSTEATEDFDDPSNSELRITLNPTAGDDEEECSLDTPQDEIGFGDLLDYLSELQESCA